MCCWTSGLNRCSGQGRTGICTGILYLSRRAQNDLCWCTAIKVEIYDGTTLLSTITAQEFREDLKSAEKETENMRLITRFLEQFETGRSHTISVRYAGTTSQLPDSPKTLLFPKS